MRVLVQGCLGVWGFRVGGLYGLGFFGRVGVWGLGFRALGFGLRVQKGWGL